MPGTAVPALARRGFTWYSLQLRMRTRGFTSLLAFGLLVTSPVTGGLSYLCQMSELVRSECCCKRSVLDTKAGGSRCDSLESANGCCEVKVTEASRMAATAEATKLQLPPAPALAAVSVLADVARPASAITVRRMSARGPPTARGIPLFVEHCSFLI